MRWTRYDDVFTTATPTLQKQIFAMCFEAHIMDTENGFYKLVRDLVCMAFGGGEGDF